LADILGIVWSNCGDSEIWSSRINHNTQLVATWSASPDE
jgi:hypothetical protein